MSDENKRIRGNKNKIRDALLQAMEDYTVSAEDAIKSHQMTLLASRRHELGLIIEKCGKRIKMLMEAIKELME